MTDAESSYPRWVEFERKYHDHPALAADAIYAIPTGVIRSLQEDNSKEHRHGPLFSDSELQFERDLAELSGTGFFLKRPIRYFSFPGPLKLLPKPEQERELDDRHRLADESIRQMLKKTRGSSQWTPEEDEKRNANLDANLEQCQLGYAAWLITDAGFCRARDNLCEKWAKDIESLGRFPRIPLSLVGTSNSIPPEGFEDLYQDFQVFYELWGLESFATWQLPVPMQAELVKPTLYDVKSTLSAGSTFFVPWFMMRANDIRLHDLMQRRLTASPPEHLMGWIEARNNPKKFGPKRFAAMLRVYVYVELALKCRYPNQIAQQAERVDNALIDLLGCGNDSSSVSRIRQEMQRRLTTVANGP